MDSGKQCNGREAAQESLLKAFHALRYFHQGFFRGWLLRIVTNTSYDRLCQLKRIPFQLLFTENEAILKP